MFDIFVQQIDKIRETVVILDQQHGEKITPETLMTQITLLENLGGVIDAQLEVLRAQTDNIITKGEPN